MEGHTKGMSEPLDTKTVIVAGAGPGLGGQVARLAVRDGANVVLGARTEAKLKALAAELDPTGEGVVYRSTDLLDDVDREALVALAVERYGRLDGIAIVAADDAVMGGLAETSEEQWRNVLETNVTATMALVGAAAAAMEHGGSIVLVGSLQGSRAGSLVQTAYAASKGASQAAMRHVAHELGPRNVRVNTVVPTWMWGPPVQGYVAWQAQERGVSEDEVLAEICEIFPLGEMPTDADVAEMIVFLCSERARMLTGQTIHVNAGEFMP
jgi:NAD(P)-dependent dehydrogenase (short-subunit alcohol dehydrogenase family)